MSPVLSRRQFLRAATVSAAVVPVVTPAHIVSRLAGERHVVGTDVPDWVAKARAQIPATKDAFFQTAGIAPSPQPVLEVIKRQLDLQNTGPVHPEVYPLVAAAEPDLRAHLGQLFNASPDEVALTHSTSEGINIASWAINWNEGDEVIISNQEHPANTIPWYNLATRFGIVIRRIDLTAGTDLLEEIRRTVNGRTRMVSIPHVSRNNGRRIRTTDSTELATYLRDRNILYHLDGAQGPGCVHFDFRSLGCDYYSTCGHKWLLGPKGTGAFFCRAEMLDRTHLTWTGSHSHVSMDNDGSYELIPEARRFEFGTRALADFAGFDAALTWVEEIGIGRILDRVDELVAYAIEEWVGRGHAVSSPTTPDDRSGVFVLRLPEGCDGWEIYEALRTRESTFTSPVDDPLDLRVAIHFFNTREEIDATFKAIELYCTEG